MSHPSLTPAQAERLEMLAEEAAEIVQACTKILQHGYESHHPNDPGQDNRDLLEEEIDDLGGVLFGMVQAGDFSSGFGKKMTAGSTWQRKLRYTHHQKEIGG